MAIATKTGTYKLDDNQIGFLHKREQEIQDKQQEAKKDVLGEQTLDLEIE